MNLQLSPQQLLSLYELTVSSLSSQMDAETNASLKEVRQKLHDSILGVLDEVYSTKNETTFSNWSKREQNRIASLTDDLKKIKVTSSQIKPLHSEEDNETHNDDGLIYPPPGLASSVKKI